MDIGTDDTSEGRMAPEPRESARARWIWRLVPYVLALFFALWSLRGVGAGNVVDTDAARHAMNGAFLRDLLTSGSLTDPMAFARHFYAHLPSLSMPYHPPLFPLAEALCFLFFGVHLLTARMLIAAAVAVSAVLIYRLVAGCSGSRVAAVCTVVTFFSLRDVQNVASDVMLEFPAMVLSLAALHFLRDLENGFPLKRGLAFALLAGAAVWTKQQAVYLGMVPFLFVLLAWKWRLLRGKTIWISAAVFGAVVFAYTLLTIPFHGAGVDQAARPEDMADIFANNIVFYAHAMAGMLGLLPALALGALLAASFFLGSRRLRILLAWGVAAFTLLLLIGPYDRRYLFFALPAFFGVAYATLETACERLLGATGRSWVPAAIALVVFALGLTVPTTYMRGPAEVANLLVDGTPRRIMYCGTTDGTFMFAARSRDARLQTVVITADKLPPQLLAPVALEQFATRYGVSYIVVERALRSQAWDHLTETPAPSMVLERKVPLESSNKRWNGQLAVYRFTNPSPNPASTLELPLPRVGGSIEVRF